MRFPLAALFAIPLILGAPAVGDAAAKNKNKAKGGPVQVQGKANKGTGGVSAGILLATVISATERALIGDYVRKAKRSNNGLPPGLAKRDRLPPGLQKHIQRTGRLPPGLEKRTLPGDLRSRLPRRAGQDYRVVGTDIVLIETATNLILDIMQGVLR
ncbi:MAG: hypothetical protein O7I42_20695 [Alphaproteobacteria bacterium]|nr:hypothetical protein [Alphaproteobacteria bacterium]